MIHDLDVSYKWQYLSSRYNRLSDIQYLDFFECFFLHVSTWMQHLHQSFPLLCEVDAYIHPSLVLISFFQEIYDSLQPSESYTFLWEHFSFSQKSLECQQKTKPCLFSGREKSGDYNSIEQLTWSQHAQTFPSLCFPQCNCSCCADPSAVMNSDQ